MLRFNCVGTVSSAIFLLNHHCPKALIYPWLDDFYKAPLPPQWLFLGSPTLMDPHPSQQRTDLITLSCTRFQTRYSWTDWNERFNFSLVTAVSRTSLQFTGTRTVNRRQRLVTASCQTNLVIVLPALSLLFWHFH